MPSESDKVNFMIDKFCQLINCPPPHEVARINLCRKFYPLSDEACRKAFRSMAETWKYNNFPPPAEWSIVINQSSFIDESKDRINAFFCDDDEKPTSEDWDIFNKELSKLIGDNSIPEENKAYCDPKKAIEEWEKRREKVHEAIILRSNIPTPKKKEQR